MVVVVVVVLHFLIGYSTYRNILLFLATPVELLDEEEFKEDSETNAYNESSSMAAKELGLMEEDIEKKLIFIQLPTTLPVPKQSVETNGEGSSKPSKDKEPLSKGSNLKELPAGLMGKMLVYKSGAVKLKLGDHLYNVSTEQKSWKKLFLFEYDIYSVNLMQVSGGLDCSFAQDVVAIDTEEKSCCNVGVLNKRAIITPDIDSILDKIKDL
ncbi:putative DNA-directed RNA polymerase III subunit RPC4 [Helianthus debilis subsp. tardiflorus]